MRTFWIHQVVTHVLLKKKKKFDNLCEILYRYKYLPSFCYILGTVEVNVNLKVGVVNCLAGELK